MSASQSTEALARRAVEARAHDDASLREAYGAALEPRASLDSLLPALRARRAALAPVAIEGADAILDPGRAERVLLAEAITSIGCARAVARHRAHRLTSTGQPGMPSLAPDALMRRLRRTQAPGDRRATLEVVDAAEDAARGAAVAMVDALRGASAALDGPLIGALGWAVTDARALALAVLSITEDPYVEMRRARAARMLGRGLATRSLADHGALLATLDADLAMPLPDREGIASRWCGRIGLPVARLASGVPAPGSELTLRLLIGDPERRPQLVGAPAADAHGVLELTSVVGELLTLREVGGGPIADALGVTRLHGASAATLARQLSLGAPFLVREAAVDRGRTQATLRDLLFVELERLRTLAAHSLCLCDALDRAPGLGERVAETFGKALGVDHAPARAPHRVCEAWHAQAPRWLEGALHATLLSSTLVEQHDEDWFRNPRAGATLRGAIDAMRAIGPTAIELDALRRAVDGWYRAAGA